MKMMQQPDRSFKAPELYGDRWYNTEPLSIHASAGQNILLYFWNYTSPASIRILPMIKEWFHTYADLGLVCIGVHSPEFNFAKAFRKVEGTLMTRDITFPVVTDNERLIADAYRVTEFPTVILIGPNGTVYDTVTQVHSFARLERSIQYLLRQSGFFGELPMLRSIESERTPGGHFSEINTGYLHGSLGNSEGYSPELPAEYHDPRIYIEGKFYAHGLWRAGRNTFQYLGEPNEGYLVCISKGSSVDALLGDEEKKISVRILSDERLLTLEQMGEDVKRDAKGNSIVTIDEPRYVSLFRGKAGEEHAVRIVPSAPGTTFYKMAWYTPIGASGDSTMIRNN